MEINTVLTGFKYKPTHDDIHFLVVNEVTGETGFSTDIHNAKKFNSQAQATRAIYAELLDFAVDGDYEWTPVLTDETGKEVGNIRPFFKVGTPQFNAQDYPHFANIVDRVAD